MTQTGTVVAVTKQIVVVAVKQTTACDGCHKKDGCTTCTSVIEITAENACGALCGDTVEIESSSGKVLLYALLVFVVPFIPAVVAYLLAYQLTDGELLSILSATVALVFTFLVLRLTIDRKAKTHLDHIATRVI